jgi:hypothetical protein
MGSVWIPYNGSSTASGFVSKQLQNPDLINIEPLPGYCGHDNTWPARFLDKSWW